MGRYLLRRLVTLSITLLGIMVMTFFISLVVPMDPLAALAGPQAPQETVERLRALYGFDQPIYVQFGRYANRLLHGDLGVSFQTSRPVFQDILKFFRPPWSWPPWPSSSASRWGSRWACCRPCTGTPSWTSSAGS